jgi:hypothetical protein
VNPSVRLRGSIHAVGVVSHREWRPLTVKGDEPLILRLENKGGTVNDSLRIDNA